MGTSRLRVFPMDPLPTSSPDRKRIGDFEILRELGRGGMGVVYEAVQVSLGRKVALKILSTGLGLTPQAVQRFQREAESAAKLHQTNIIPIYATGAQDGIHFYAMELIEGPSLDHVIRQMRGVEKGEPSNETPVPADGSDLTVAYDPTARDSHSGSTVWMSSSLSSGAQYFDTVARLMAEVADALEYAHRHGVVHRDIKPANLLVAPEGRLSLNDFGLARVLEQPGMTATGEILGTPAYMSPEQLTAGRTPLDHRTDIYSLGATLYELLTLQRPFVGERRDQVLSQILHKDPRPPRSINKKVPVDLETICLKAMEKDPDRRYQTAGALAEDLRRYVNRFAISARRVGPTGRMLKWVRRHPGVTTGISCAFIALVIAGFFANRANKSEQRRIAEREQSLQRIAAVERDRALENALVAATGGDLDKAADAINEAESKGASAAQVRTLRGQVAYFQGDLPQALSELEQAVKLSPESVAARGMLALTYVNLGDFTQYLRQLTILESLAPVTDEDYIFKGYSKYWMNPGQALQELNKAVDHSRSPLARAICADVRWNVAEQHSDAEEARRALRDIQAAKEYLSDNPVVLSISVFANLAAANVFRERQLFTEQQDAFQHATIDAEQLDRWKSLRYPSDALWSYYSRLQNEQKMLEIAQKSAEHSTIPNMLHRYAVVLCRRGQFADALNVLDRRQWREIDGDCLRAYILAEMNPGNADAALASIREAYEYYSKKIISEHMSSELDTCRRIFFLLGRNDEAISAYRAARPRLAAETDVAEKCYFDYGCDDISEDELMRSVEMRGERLAAYQLIALRHLAQGDRSAARKAFERAHQLQMIEWSTVDLMRTYLIRMEQDPTWPPWIPIKKSN